MNDDIDVCYVDCFEFTEEEVLETATYEINSGNFWDRYLFSFERQPDRSIRAYIMSTPSYDSRDESLHNTRRSYDGQRHYVDWGTPLYNLDDAKKVAALWAKRTHRYIRTGKPFES